MGKKSNCGCIATLFVLVAVAVAMFVTRPDKQAHEEAIKSVMSQAISETCDSLTKADDDLGMALVSNIGSAMATTVTDELVEKLLVVDDYGVVTVGRIGLDDDKQPVSLGVLGHVYTVDKETVKSAAQKYIKKKINKMVDGITRKVKDYANDLINKLLE